MSIMKQSVFWVYFDIISNLNRAGKTSHFKVDTSEGKVPR